MASFCIDVSAQQRPLATAAATWLVRFYSGTSIVPDGDALVLMSETRNEGELQQLWQAALLNEAQFAACQPFRRQMLEQLTR